MSADLMAFLRARLGVPGCRASGGAIPPRTPSDDSVLVVLLPDANEGA
jgi:hypothetical protein